MWILFCSDFHNCLMMEQLQKALCGQPSPDVVFTLGDISVRDLHFIKNMILPAPVYGVCGNHDSHTSLILSEIPNIHRKSVTISGVSFAGFEGSVRYKRGSYTMFTQKESLEESNGIPSANILLSHDRAFCGKVVDKLSEYSKSPHEGLIGIFEYLKQHSPHLHVHGHIHKNARYLFHGVETISVYGVVLICFENNKIQDYRILLEPA